MSHRSLLFLSFASLRYVRMNRSRLKGKYGAEDSHNALLSLFQVLFGLCKLMAPFTPFFVDSMYNNLKRVLPKEQQMDCVHYAMIPPEDASQVQPAIETSIQRMQTVIELGRTARNEAKLTMKRPLRSAVVVHPDAGYLADVRSLEQYVREELNVRTVDFSSEVDKFILLKAVPNRKTLGGRFGKTSNEFATAISNLSHAAVLAFQKAGSVEINGQKLTKDEIDVTMQFQGDRSKMMDCGNNDVLVIINTEEDAELMAESMAREITRRVQQLRKQAGLVPTDDVEFFFIAGAPAKGAKPSALVPAITSQSKFIRETLGREIYPASEMPAHAMELVRGDLVLEGEATLTLVVTRMFVSFRADEIAKMAGAAGVTAASLQVAQQFLTQRDWASFRAAVQAGQASVTLSVDGVKVMLTHGKHFFFSVKEATDARAAK